MIAARAIGDELIGIRAEPHHGAAGRVENDGVRVRRSARVIGIGRLLGGCSALVGVDASARQRLARLSRERSARRAEGHHRILGDSGNCAQE